MIENCHLCGRPLSECRETVDERWPAAAREAYAAAGYADAATCSFGQTGDVKATGGWCWDRARRHEEWTGKPLTDAERRGRP
jgi:hypothetical protein